MINQVFINNIIYLIDNKAAKKVRQFAFMLNIPASTIYSWLDGKAVASAKHAAKIKEAFSYDLETLLRIDISTQETKVAEPRANYNIDKLHPDPEIHDLLVATTRVLTSGTRHANALKENILSFDEAVEDKKLVKERPPDVPSDWVAGGDCVNTGNTK